eukprot:CAMPEP_0181397042 /NCGR_PEP_ID=MMETSP1110-20121109/252_1 /TAXON_ID=174948 /ORGANISM="Symbiodinium sp., Strain CCMP421" /LENGTH=112 /DNA_ID=CAMNT_0023518811 /DNA_START=297 /DNA_END=632 /DNA_ORIENTATION=-
MQEVEMSWSIAAITCSAPSWSMLSHGSPEANWSKVPGVASFARRNHVQAATQRKPGLGAGSWRVRDDLEVQDSPGGQTKRGVHSGSGPSGWRGSSAWGAWHGPKELLSASAA